MGKIAKTASEILAQIEKECFKGVNLKKACGLKGEGCGLDPFWGWSLLGHFCEFEDTLEQDITIIR